MRLSAAIPVYDADKLRMAVAAAVGKHRAYDRPARSGVHDRQISEGVSFMVAAGMAIIIKTEAQKTIRLPEISMAGVIFIAIPPTQKARNGSPVANGHYQII